MYHKNFKYLPWVENIEVAWPTICGFDTQKSPLFGVFAVFSGTALELMVPTIPPNSHPRPHLMPKEPTDLLNWSRRWTISGVQNVTLYYKIDKVIQLFWWLYKWSLAQGLYKTLNPLFLFQIEPEISTPEKSYTYVLYILLRINYDCHRSFHFGRAVLSTHNIYLFFTAYFEWCRV